MRVRTLLKGPVCTAYTVECRHREHPAWIEESSHRTELVYPVKGGFLLEKDGGAAVCLPARLTLIPAGSRYRIRHFTGLPDITLVMSARNTDFPVFRPDILHLFPGPAEIAALQLLVAPLLAGAECITESMVSRLTARILECVRVFGIPQERLVSAGLEPAFEQLLAHRATMAKCALAAGYSESHFRHRFCEIYATIPHAVQRALRLADALRIMLQGCTATRAAQTAGFAHVSHLSREVRQLTGCSPRDLLRASRDHGASAAGLLWDETWSSSSGCC